MTDLMARPVIPVANETDAETTYAAAAPYLDPDSRPLLVNVIEKAGGAPDKASVEQRREVAEAAFAAFAELAAADGVAVDEEIRYDTDVVDAIVGAATDSDGTAIAFVSRGGGRIVQFLSGGVRSKLIADPTLPVVVLPTVEG
ncbi:universal stress protein [Halorubrum vacuolatum]|uniref:Nucleotide-binding universal stress protein, UspA family n=1 Tax=Halorubrum vacuolatum TaxID=63740 RepID=A0A238US77_HALVU|nr:universal stress protein [Halorubrum vacuolatum]SNR24303.1 Nucleotide-binding universal stress protein, UspA family [Halorubrum vacuolatum]